MYRIQVLLAFALLLAFVGCSSEKSPTTPNPAPQHPPQLSENISNRTVWGYWNIKFDPDCEAVEIIPVRDMASHFNVLRLLEITPCTDCLSIKNLSFLPDNIVQCDFQLRHPFPGLDKFTGFDVRGVLVTNGDTTFPEINRLASLDGSNPILLNPDGFTALFNPVEFPEGSSPFPILEYIPGKFSFGDDFTATLNPFMAFCKDKPRRMFEAGATESVTINLKYPSTPFEFGYVADASWTKVDEVTDPLTDFPPEANCLEPYKIICEVLSSVIDEIGSSAPLLVEIFDHQGLDTISTVSIECPTLFYGEIFLSYSSQSSDDSWFFDGIISNDYGVTNGSYPALIKAVSTESDPNLGVLAAYQIEKITVGTTGNLIWAKRAGGTGSDNGYAVTTLSDDSTVVTGGFKHSATFGEDEANKTVLVADDQHDIFVARYFSDGTLAWAKSAGGMLYDSGYGITTLSDDSTVVTGCFHDSATFGAGEPNETVLVSDGIHDIFVARYNPDGSLAWAKRAGGSDLDVGYGITTLSDNSTVVTGVFCGSTTFGIGEVNETILVSGGDIDIFVARYNSDGTLAWAKRAGGTSQAASDEITSLSDDSTAVTGIFKGAATFGEGEANETTLISSGPGSFFVARYNPDGTIAWVTSTGGVAHSAGGHGVTTLLGDSTVVAGWFTGTTIFGEGEVNETVIVTEGSTDSFIARYNPDGTLAWARRAGGTSSDLAYAITTLSDDSTAVIGRFKGEATFGEGEANESLLVSTGDYDIFLARYNPDGTLLWARQGGGISPDHSHGITTLSDDTTVATGCFKDSATFGAGEPNETVLVSAGWFDIFIARFAP